MHDWIIEGLPPQVLIHHKKMLGIYESETEDEQQQSVNQSQSIVDDIGGEVFQNTSGRHTEHTYGRPSDVDQLELDLFHHHIDSNDLSNSQI